MKPLGTATDPAEVRAEAVLSALPGLDPAGIAYSPAAAGVASPSFHAVESTSFSVTMAGNLPEAFLKLTVPQIASLVDLGVAFRVAGTLHDMGLAPKPLHLDTERGGILFAHLGADYRSARIDDLATPDRAAALVGIHRTIAQGAPFGRSWTVFSGIRQLKTELATLGRRMPADADWLFAVADMSEAAIEAAGYDLRPAHADPHSSNVMIGPDGRLVLVDFDMAADVDPYYQLGTQMNELYQFDSDMKPLLEVHDGAYSEAAFARCRLYAAVDDLYWALRSLIHEELTSLKSLEFLKYAEWRFLRCRMLMGRPGFEALIRAI